MEDLQKLPVIALRNTVLFPGITSPIQAGRPETVAAINAAMEADQTVFAVMQREDRDEIEPENLHAIGVIAKFMQVEQAEGALKLLLSGVSRSIAVRIEPQDGYFVAQTSPATIRDVDRPDKPLFVALEKEVREKALELGQKAGLPTPMLRQALESVSDLGRLADLVASYLDIAPDEKQAILDEFDVEARLRAVLVQLNRQIEVVDTQRDIQSQVQETLGERQREMLLREQLKAIHSQLGDDDGGQELEDLKEKLDALDLTPDVRSEIDREFRRLASMGRESMESQVLRTYLETVTELPWNSGTEDVLDLAEAQRILDEDHFGLSDVKDRVVEFLAVLKLKAKRAAEEDTSDEASKDSVTGDSTSEDSATGNSATGKMALKDNTSKDSGRSPILLFTGPPGVGKTSIARSIARSMGREYVRISLGGARDEADIRGHRRTYVGALPGRIIQGMRQAGTSNPVFLLDEIDKLGASYQGDPSSALLEVLDPAQNNAFVDHYLGVPFDLSKVMFIATANVAQNIPAPLLDRMEVVEFSGYTEAEKSEIAARYLWPRQLRENGIEKPPVELESDAAHVVISQYTREAGVRQLDKTLGTLARKIATRRAREDEDLEKVRETDVRELLGRPKVRPEKRMESGEVGVATGMFYTPMGGDILFVEATTMAGDGKLTLTGQLGDVMRESAQAAWTFGRAMAPELLIDKSRFRRDVHVHVPAGAVPKDGPSAGVTLATALISALAGIPVHHDIAMTGEITVTGRVLPVGGIKEKVLGALRAGIDRVILPKDNLDDLEDLPSDVLERIEFHGVEQLTEVLELALAGGVFRADAV